MSAELRERLASQLDDAFPELVDAHGAMVLTLAVRMTDPTTGQDITQEVFLRAYRALAGYAAERISALDLRPWLVTITRNLVRNEYRRRDRKSTLPLQTRDVVVEDATTAAVDTIVARAQVDELLDTLSDSQREAVVLRHMVGLPLRDVALTMACPEGTAKSHVSRGLDRLRVELAAVEMEGSRQ